MIAKIKLILLLGVLLLVGYAVYASSALQAKSGTIIELQKTVQEERAANEALKKIIQEGNISVEIVRENDIKRAKELEDVKNENESLKQENEQYRLALEFVIPGVCLRGLRGYDPGPGSGGSDDSSGSDRSDSIAGAST